MYVEGLARNMRLHVAAAAISTTSFIRRSQALSKGAKSATAMWRNPTWFQEDLYPVTNKCTSTPEAGRDGPAATPSGCLGVLRLNLDKVRYVITPNYHNRAILGSKVITLRMVATLCKSGYDGLRRYGSSSIVCLQSALDTHTWYTSCGRATV